MKIERFLSSMALTAFALVSFNALAASVNVTEARHAANNFLKQRTAVEGRFNAPALADIKLAHAEASSVEGNAYYVFNVQGGGWVIIAGDDRANQVLAYGDKGAINMNNLPVSMKGYLDMYKHQIEKVQSAKGKIVTSNAPMRTTAVAPLLRSVNWSQQSPFNWQCPTYNGSRSSVGCAALAMAQVVNYWEYPKEMPAIPGYQNSYYFSQVPSLEGRTMDYDLIRDQYTTCPDEEALAYVPGVTDEEKQEVGWLCRYCAQACRMNFSPDGSGSNVLKQKNAFLELGYSENAKLVGIEAWPSRETWNTTDYTNEEWIALINAQLEAGHPIPYSSEDIGDGHAFVVDGVDANGLYHVSWGWYGCADGWYQFGAFNPVVQEQYMNYNSALFMIIDLIPYEGYEPPHGDVEVIPGDVNGDKALTIGDVTALINYLLNQDASSINMDAADVNGDQNVTIGDVTALINKLLTNS